MRATVAIPTWRSQHILWLQLESLCRQEDAHDWEIVMYACDYGESAAILESYWDRLWRAGCVSTHCITNEGAKKPLGDKWREIARHGTGKTMLLAASDNYSPPDRIKVSCEAIESGATWYDCGEGLFYNIATSESGTWMREPGQTGLWMAADREFMANLEGDGPRAGIDAWIMGQLPGDAKIVRNERKMDGVHTDGANTISLKRGRFYDGVYSRNFHAPTQKISRILPPGIYGRLRAMK